MSCIYNIITVSIRNKIVNHNQIGPLNMLANKNNKIQLFLIKISFKIY